MAISPCHKRKQHQNESMQHSVQPKMLIFINAAFLSVKTIFTSDAKSGKVLHTLEGHTDFVNSVVFSHDGKKLISSSHDKTARIWDLERLPPKPWITDF
jgi:WD40 repeat protein